MLSIAANGAQEFDNNFKVFSCTDPELDWQQYDEKTGKALVTKKGLELESKKEDYYCLTFAELPINVEDDNFTVGFQMIPGDISDDKPFGIVFNYGDESDYYMLLILKNSLKVMNVKDGKMSVVKKGIYKRKNKSKMMTVTMTRDYNKLAFAIDGLEMMKIKCPKLEYPNFGFAVAPKAKMICINIAYQIEERKDTEESDSL